MDNIADKYISKLTTTLLLKGSSGFIVGITADTQYLCYETDAQHNQFVISWILRGRGSFCEEKRSYHLHDMCVCIRRPDRTYRMEIEEIPSVRLYVELPRDLYPLLTRLLPELEYIPSVQDKPFSKQLFDEFMSLQASFKKSTPEDLYMLIPSIIHYILGASGIADSRCKVPIFRARSMLEDYSSTLSLEQIAEACGMKYNTFRKRFQNSFGISPGKYRIKCRIEGSCHALSTGESVNSVAERFGYPDIYTFTHQFKSVTGLSPTQYRNQNRL